MKIKGLRYADNGEPAEFDVVLTTQQMGIIYALVGNVSRTALEKLEGSKFTEDFFALCDTADEMNRFYDDGIHEVMPMMLGKVISDVSTTITDPLP